jgi:hypothetical protein
LDIIILIYNYSPFLSMTPSSGWGAFRLGIFFHELCVVPSFLELILNTSFHVMGIGFLAFSFRNISILVS